MFGAGGDRDTGKRKQMGEVADKYADEIIHRDNLIIENSSYINFKEKIEKRGKVI